MKPTRDKRRDTPQQPLRHRVAAVPERRVEEATDARTEGMSAKRRELRRREGALPAERLPLILEVAPSEEYALLDSGSGEKLEQYGPYRIVRPEGQAIWQRALPAKEWNAADAIFTGDTDE